MLFTTGVGIWNHTQPQHESPKRPFLRCTAKLVLLRWSTHKRQWSFYEKSDSERRPSSFLPQKVIRFMKNWWSSSPMKPQSAILPALVTIELTLDARQIRDTRWKFWWSVWIFMSAGSPQMIGMGKKFRRERSNFLYLSIVSIPSGAPYFLRSDRGRTMSYQIQRKIRCKYRPKLLRK